MDTQGLVSQIQSSNTNESSQQSPGDLAHSSAHPASANCYAEFYHSPFPSSFGYLEIIPSLLKDWESKKNTKNTRIDFLIFSLLTFYPIVFIIRSRSLCPSLTPSYTHTHRHTLLHTYTPSIFGTVRGCCVMSPLHFISLTFWKNVSPSFLPFGGKKIVQSLFGVEVVIVSCFRMCASATWRCIFKAQPWSCTTRTVTSFVIGPEKIPFQRVHALPLICTSRVRWGFPAFCSLRMVGLGTSSLRMSVGAHARTR